MSSSITVNANLSQISLFRLEFAPPKSNLPSKSHFNIATKPLLTRISCTRLPQNTPTQQQINLSVLRFTLGIPGLDESYLPRYIAYTFGTLLMLNHFVGSDLSSITSAQLRSEVLGLSLTAFSVVIPYLGKFLKGASSIDQKSIPKGAEQIFVMSQNISDTLKEDLAWGTYILLRNTNSISMFIVVQDALCVRGYWNTPRDVSKENALDWFKKQIQRFGFSNLKDTIYFPQVADSELLGMLPEGTRTLLVQPIFHTPKLSSNQPEKGEGFVLLASTVDYAYSDKDKAWIVAISNKFRGFCAFKAESLCIAQESKMMRKKTRRNELPHMSGGSSAAAGADNEWELRPGGMLVQKRTGADQNLVPPPMIRVYVKYGSINHQIRISSEASFGELKKMLTGPTGLHHQDQKLYYKDKERDSKAFLDAAGVKDKSKIVLVEDTIGKEKRYLEMKKKAKIEKDKKLISEITLEIDRLARQVSSLESVISRGGKVVEKDVINLIELLMNQLLKLDGVIGDDDVKLQRKMQAKRVQKYVETLDMLKIKNSMTTSTQQKVYSSGLVSSPPVHQNRYSNPSISTPLQQQQAKHSLIDSLKQPSSHLATEPVVITMQWETFDSTPPRIPGAPSASTINPAQTSLTWDLI
ncbi:unnamed protein product [Fraxinus pennsylvanica]|uniref:BAG domain-containing protein n=1 Tax=Fraxinus pennsylvanica TaxID=56036 RepID=A0AAD1Z447_9LAMI|nr:unnamed protein product [Fraxinus pennsylvanica]